MSVLNLSEENPYSAYIIPEIYRIKLYEMMMEIMKEFTKFDLHFFLDGGSALAVARGGQIILHDDDVDIGTYEVNPELADLSIGNNYQLLYNKVKLILQNIAERTSYRVQDVGELLKLFVPNMYGITKELPKRVIGTPTIDFFLYTKHKKHYKLHPKEFSKKWPDSKYETSDLVEYKTFKFTESLQLQCPVVKNLEKYMDNQYPDWRTVYEIEIRDNTNHKLEKIKMKIPFI